MPSGPETTLTEDAIAARDAAMFVDGAAGPAASDLLPLAKEASGALVQLAAARVKGWPEARIKALSASFRNFDRVVGLGWLIGDALGLPLMTRAEAHAVGLKARRDAGTLKEEITNAHRQAGRKASKLAATDPARAQLKEEAAQKEQTLLRAVIELPLPSPAQQPRSNATGARKRKHESLHRRRSLHSRNASMRRKQSAKSRGRSSTGLKARERRPRKPRPRKSEWRTG